MVSPVFSHSTVNYVFRGREVPPPKPGTYDPKHFTPPTHQVFHVCFQSDGYWWIKLWESTIATGSWGKRPSRKAAEELLKHHCKQALREPDFQKT